MRLQVGPAQGSLAEIEDHVRPPCVQDVEYLSSLAVHRGELGAVEHAHDPLGRPCQVELFQ